MRFQPSAYAAPPFSPFGAVEGGASGGAEGAAIEVAGKLATVGLDAWQKSADAKADKWRKLAAKKAAKKKKAAERKAAAAVAAQQTVVAPTPVQAAATMNPMLKWGLVAAGIGLVGFAVYMLTRKKEEPSKPKPNPRRAFIKTKPKRRNPEIRAAATEIPAVTLEGVDEFSGPDDDALAGDDYAGDDYAGEEGGE